MLRRHICSPRADSPTARAKKGSQTRTIKQEDDVPEPEHERTAPAAGPVTTRGRVIITHWKDALSGVPVKYPIDENIFRSHHPFFARVGTVNARRVPAVALVIQGVWAALLTLPRTVTRAPQTGAPVYGNVYTQLLEYIVSADLVFYALMVGAVIVLRRKRPEAARPYRTFGYPFVPLLYIGLAALLVADLAYQTPATSGIGYLLVLTGIPIYFLWRKKAGTEGTPQRGTMNDER